MYRILFAALFGLGFTADAQALGDLGTYICHVPGPVTGKVISPNAISLTGFKCIVHGNTTAFYNYGNATGYGPPQSRKRFQVTMNVKLNNPADANKMKIGTIVTLDGHFTDTPDRQFRKNMDYLAVTDAKIVK